MTDPHQPISRVGPLSSRELHPWPFMTLSSTLILIPNPNPNPNSTPTQPAGTGPELYGNLNAPPAVTASAVIYCLRCLIPDVDIPLNQGCLVPVQIRIPPSSLLNPSPTAGVVGGNVLTSQR